MSAGGELGPALRAWLTESAAAELDGVLLEARHEARNRVRAILADALTEAMLAAAAREPVQTGKRAEPAEPTEPPAPAEPASAFSPPPAGAGHSPDSTAWYLYGVAPAEDGTPLDALPGIDPEQSVVTLWEAGLAVFASRVPRHDFDEERLREHLSDMAWVELVARRHQEILDALARTRTLVPMRMCSIYRDEAGLRSMLAAEAPALTDALERLRGKAEWGVKAFASRRPQSAEVPSRTQPGERAGAAYLAERSHQRRSRQAAEREATEACERVYARLAEVAEEARTVPPQRPEVSGHAGEMLLNSVYLVADAKRERFHEAVRELGEGVALAGLELELTGPWPAYNFVPDAIGLLR